MNKPSLANTLLSLYAQQPEPQDGEVKLEVGRCSVCGTRWPVSVLIQDYGHHDGWELPAYLIHECPKCPDGGCVDDYDGLNHLEASIKRWVQEGLTIIQIQHALEVRGQDPAHFIRLFNIGWVDIWRKELTKAETGLQIAGDVSNE